MFDAGNDIDLWLVKQGLGLSSTGQPTESEFQAPSYFVFHEGARRVVQVVHRRLELDGCQLSTPFDVSTFRRMGAGAGDANSVYRHDVYHLGTTRVPTRAQGLQVGKNLNLDPQRGT